MIDSLSCSSMTQRVDMLRETDVFLRKSLGL